MNATTEIGETVRFSDRVLTVPESAKHLRISIPTLYKLINNGSLIPFHIGTRTFFNGGELLRFVAAAQAKR